jgi:hypothetical protein
VCAAGCTNTPDDQLLAPVASTFDNKPFDYLPMVIGQDQLIGGNHFDHEIGAMTGQRREVCKRDERTSGGDEGQDELPQ